MIAKQGVRLGSSVSTAELEDDSVTAPKLASGAIVSTDNITIGSVTLTVEEWLNI